MQYDNVNVIYIAHHR